MELEFYAFRELFENYEFFHFVLPLLFFSTMVFAVLQFVTSKAQGNLPLTQKTNIIISIIFGFLTTYNRDAVEFLLNNFFWVILLFVFAYIFLIIQKISPRIDYIPIIIMLGIVVLMLNNSILKNYESYEWIIAIVLFFGIFWAVYKSKD